MTWLFIGWHYQCVQVLLIHNAIELFYENGSFINFKNVVIIKYCHEQNHNVETRNNNKERIENADLSNHLLFLEFSCCSMLDSLCSLMFLQIYQVYFSSNIIFYSMQGCFSFPWSLLFKSQIHTELKLNSGTSCFRTVAYGSIHCWSSFSPAGSMGMWAWSGEHVRHVLNIL